MDTLRLIGSTILMPDYRRLPKYRQKLSNPRELCAMWAMLQATWRANEDFGNQNVEFIFDQRQKQIKTLSETYDAVLKTEHGHLCLGWGQVDHRKVSPVQAADLVAYESKKYLDGRLAGKGRFEELRWPVKQLENMFFKSKAGNFDYKTLWLSSDVWGNYGKAKRFLGL
jgi:hypothetical protein